MKKLVKRIVTLVSALVLAPIFKLNIFAEGDYVVSYEQIKKITNRVYKYVKISKRKLKEILNFCKDNEMSLPAYVHALYYFNETSKNDKIQLQYLNAEEIKRVIYVATVMSLAFKVDEDYSVWNEDIADALKLSVKEISKAEVEILNAIDWRAVLLEDRYEIYRNMIDEVIVPFI